jgi:Domain of unknown function (DUF397)
MPDVDLSRAVWHKSSHSSQDGNCVEVARNLPDIVAIRDSKNPNAPAMLIGHEAWGAFIELVKDGSYLA